MNTALEKGGFKSLIYMPDFAAIIKPSPNGTYSHWSQEVAFGELLTSSRCSGFTQLKVDDESEGGLFAAFAGTISVRRPTGHVQAPVVPPSGAPLAGAGMTLYLEPSNKLSEEWVALSAAIKNRFSTTTDLALSADSIYYLEYRNVSTTKARSTLLPRIRSQKEISDEKKWNGFLAGAPVNLTAGDAIGAALFKEGVGRCDVGLHTRYGLFDLGTWYKDMTSTAGVSTPANSTPLAALLGHRLPLIAPNSSVDAAGSSRIWPWSALLQFKLQKQLTYADWRKLGDLQRAKYQTQLLARVRPASAPLNTPRFEYDVDDMYNLFQLEAVAEFYLNLPDPWDESTVPLAPNDIKFHRVNLLSLYGSSAQTNGKTVTLDGQLDMTRVMPGRDTIELASETVRELKQFRIMAVNRNHSTVTVDGTPQLSSPGSWRIFHNLTLVNIDAFGARLRGSNASSPVEKTLVLEGLDDRQVAEMRRVNPYDTISLRDVAPGTPHEARITKRAVVTSAQGVSRARITLDRVLAPVQGGSAWAIPAGVGGTQGWLDKSAYTEFKNDSASNWWDNYDGMMFLVANGEIRCVYPWTSYSSMSSVMSSIKGNVPYRFASYVSRRNLYINASFRVLSPDAIQWGDQETRVAIDPDGLATIEPELPWDASLIAPWETAYFIRPTPPRFVSAPIRKVDLGAHQLLCGPPADQAEIPPDPSPYWLLVYDGTRENRYYTKPSFHSRSVPPGQRPKIDRNGNVVPGGAMGIRIHFGENGRGSGSEGCRVSPYFRELRMAMIQCHEEANATYFAETKNDPNQDNLHHMVTAEKKPPWLAAYSGLGKAIDELNRTIKELVTDPANTAIDAVRRAGNANERVQAVEEAIEEARQNHRISVDTPEQMADLPSDDVILSNLGTLLQMLNDGDTADILQMAEANREAVSRLKRDIAKLEAERATTVERRWDDAMHGEYLLIRPDEREKALNA